MLNIRLTESSGGDRYYVLVAACVVARRQEFLKKACLAAALLFPAVAAIHGIVLAALHINREGHRNGENFVLNRNLNG